MNTVGVASNPRACDWGFDWGGRMAGTAGRAVGEGYGNTLSSAMNRGPLGEELFPVRNIRL